MSEPEEHPDPPIPNQPRRYTYFVSIEWLDDAHHPEPPERLALAIRHVLEHSHHVPPGTPPNRFVVRVKTGNVAFEADGEITPHHHHHAAPSG